MNKISNFSKTIRSVKLFAGLNFCMLISFLSAAQPKLSDFQHFSREVLSKEGVKKIVAFEKEYEKPFYDYKAIIIPDSAMLAEIAHKGEIQSIETFDTLGRIVQKENFWKYSDLGNVKYTYVWDANDRIQVIEYYKDSTLQVKEEFFYDILGSMVLWKVRVFEQNMILFKKYENDKKGNPIRINIFIGKDKIRHDSVTYTYDILGRVVKELGFDQFGNNIDSISYSYKKADATEPELSEFFVSGKRDKTLLVKENKLYKTYKKVQFSDGDFMGSTYDIFDKRGNISKEKNIHHYSQLNYEKEYSYSPAGIPLLKKVYKNGEDPETLVTFEVEYR